MQSPTPKMIAAKEGPVGWMIFNQPKKRNAVSMEMWAAIPEIIGDFENDRDIRVIVLSGAGDEAFIAGADISEFAGNRQSKEANAEYDRLISAALQTITEAAKPTLAMIKGFCIGGGVAISVSCDIRIAADNSVIGVPAARLGLGYSVPGLAQLIELVGPSFAKEIFFTAKRFNAADARMMGLVNRVAPGSELERYVRDYAAAIAGNAPLTIAAAKKAINQLSLDPEDRDLAACEAAIEACFESADYVEGRTAFLEKRKPVFTGK